MPFDLDQKARAAFEEQANQYAAILWAKKQGYFKHWPAERQAKAEAFLKDYTRGIFK